MKSNLKAMKFIFSGRRHFISIGYHGNAHPQSTTSVLLVMEAYYYGEGYGSASDIITGLEKVRNGDLGHLEMCNRKLKLGYKKIKKAKLEKEIEDLDDGRGGFSAELQVKKIEKEKLEKEIDDLFNWRGGFSAKDQYPDLKSDDERKKALREHVMECSIELLFEKFVTPNKAKNKDSFFNDVTPARAFEYLAAAYFGQKFCNLEVDLRGGANDKGVDCELKNGGETEVIIQVKCGKQLISGKGNSIVLQLAGSCLLEHVHKAFIFSSESREDLSLHTRDIVENLRNFCEYSIDISCYFFDDVHSELQDSLDCHDCNFAMAVLEDFKQRLPVKKETDS